MTEQSIYTVGGTVQAGNGVYIPRQADEQLLDLCRSRTFAYVLTPRQMGKSSLMVKTAEQLQQEDVSTAIIDLQPIGAKVSPEEWYLGLLTELEDQLDLDTDLLDWWEDLTHLGLAQRMTRFFSEVVLTEIADPIVVFIDEIDTTLSLDFTDDFFIAIRYFYTARAQNPEFERLSFVLIGVATPTDLIRDPQRTPFNVGQRVDLTDFALAEAMPLAAGLGLPAAEAEQVLGWVLGWTGGHPYLTQRLCQAVVEELGDRRKDRKGTGAHGLPPMQDITSLTQADVDQVVAATFLGGMSHRDNNLQFVRDMLTQRAPDIYQVLTTYKDIWRGRRQVEDEEQSLIKSHLKLSGVVAQEVDKTLQVRNAIYATVFDEKWIRDNLPVNWRKRIRRLQGTIAAGLLLLSLTSGLTVWALTERGRAENALLEVEKALEETKAQKNAAQKAEAEARRQQNRAEYQSQLAENRQRKAEVAEEQAEEGRQAAETAKEQAVLSQRAEAEQRQVAERQQENAESNLNSMTQLIDEISELVQGERTIGIVGFSPLQGELFEALLPYHTYIIENNAQSTSLWQSSEAHFLIGHSFEIKGDSLRAENEFRLAFDGAKAAAETLAFLGEVPQKLLQLLNKTAVFYAWNRMNYGYFDEAEDILNTAKLFSDNYKSEPNPELIMSFASLENALARLFSEQGEDEKVLEQRLLSLELAKRAVSLDEKNIRFQRSLAVFLRNLSLTPESLMSEEEADSYEREGCKIARAVDLLESSGAALLNIIVDCVRDESFQGNPDAIVESLLDARERLDVVIQLDPTNIEFKLSRAWITTRLIDVEQFQRDNQEAADRYLHMAREDWLAVVGNGNTFPSDLWKLRAIYLDLKRHLTSYDDVLKKERIFAEIVTAIDQTNEAFGDSPEIALIAADSSLQLGELKKESNPQASLVNLNKAINLFAKARVTEDTSTYSERYTWVCNAYEARLSLNYESKNLEAVLSDFEAIKNICLPIFEQYSFDFYLHAEIRSAHMKTGELLFNEGRFADAKPILEYASYWGIKESSELLARMYREGLGVQIDNSRARELEALASMQSMKRFTIPADFDTFTAPFHFYVYQKPRDYPYRGIDDQIEWLKQARGGTIPADAADAFRKLQEIAFENNVSFPELAVYALENANTEE